MSQELYHSSESTLTLVRVKRWRSIISNRYPCLTLCRRTIEIQPEVWRPSVRWESWRAKCSTPPQLLAALLQAPSLGESRFEGRLASSSERNQCAGCTHTPSSCTKGITSDPETFRKSWELRHKVPVGIELLADKVSDVPGGLVRGGVEQDVTLTKAFHDHNSRHRPNLKII